MLLATSNVAQAAISAAAGLLGVISGGLITYGTTVRVQREGHEAARQDERERRKAAAMTAWNLLRIELANARNAVYEIRRTGQWPIGWNRTWSAAWKECRDRLLASPPADLTHVAQACARIDELEKGVNAGRAAHEQNLTGKDQIFLWRMQQLLESACEDLQEPPDPAMRPPDPREPELAQWEDDEQLSPPR